MPVPSRRRSAPRRAVLLGGALVTGAALVLAGCADPDAGASPSASPSGTASSPQETPPVSPSATPFPDDRATNGTTTLEQPASGAVLTGPTVTVSGTATAFEGTLAWEVVPAGGGDPVQQGSTMAGANGELGPFTFTVDLDPGTWTVRVWEPSAAGGDEGGEGSGDERMLVTSTFTVV